MVYSDTRKALLNAAAAVIATRGVDGTSTREIYRRAGVTAPTLYHHFGDKRGLLDAVVADAFERYLAEKRKFQPTGDPYTDMRRGWDAHVAFARSNPAIYRLMFPSGSGVSVAAAAESLTLLRDGFERLAADGWLRPGVTPELATRALSAALHGVTAAITRQPAHRGNARLSMVVRDSLIETLLVPPNPAARRSSDDTDR